MVPPIPCQLNPTHSLKVRPVFLNGICSYHQTGGRKYRIILHKQPVDSRPLLAPTACASVCLYQLVCTESSCMSVSASMHWMILYVSSASMHWIILYDSQYALNHPHFEQSVLDTWRIIFRLPVDAREFSLFQNIQTGARTHAASCPVSAADALPERHSGGAWSWPLTPNSSETEKEWSSVSIAPYSVMLRAGTLHSTHAGSIFRRQVVFQQWIVGNKRVTALPKTQSLYKLSAVLYNVHCRCQVALVWHCKDRMAMRNNNKYTLHHEWSSML